MGVILFIMVTGTLPFFKEAVIKDELYKHIKSKNPELFWETWRTYFKKKASNKNDQKDELEIEFTSDEDQQKQNKDLSADHRFLF